MEVFQALQKHRVGSELRTGSFNPKIKKDQPRNPAPRSSAHVKARIILPWLTKLRFGTGILERVWPPLKPLIGAGPKCTISVCLALQMLIFPEIVGICARITGRTHLQKHLRIGFAPTPHWFTPGSRFFLHMVVSGNGHGVCFTQTPICTWKWFDPNSWQEQNIHTGDPKLRNFKSS